MASMYCKVKINPFIIIVSSCVFQYKRTTRDDVYKRREDRHQTSAISFWQSSRCGRNLWWKKNDEGPKMGPKPFKYTTKCKGYMMNGAIMLFGRTSRALSIYQTDGRVCCHGNRLTTEFTTIGDKMLQNFAIRLIFGLCFFCVICFIV